MDDCSSSSSPIPTDRKRPEEGIDGTPPEKRPCVETPPEDVLYLDSELGEELSPCFLFEDTLVSDLMRELEEEIKGPIRPAESRIEETCGPSVSRTDSSVMASVHVGTSALFFPAVDSQCLPLLDVSVPAAPADTVTEGSCEKGAGASAAVKMEEEDDDEEWLKRVLSGAPFDMEQGPGF